VLKCYIVPLVGTGVFPDSYRPKYIANNLGDAIAGITNSSCMFFGIDANVLVAANLDTSADATLTAFTDVVAFPTDLDANIGAGAVTIVQNKLEALNIPGNWVNTSYTYRDVLRMVGGLFQFANRYFAMNNLSIFRGGVTLDTTFGQLPVLERQRLQNVAADLNYDTSGVSGSTTIRAILKSLADQWGNRPLYLGEITL